MKHAFIAIACIVMVGAIASCKKDNYAAPGSILSGKIVYNGEALNFQRTVEKDKYRVRFQLWEGGWGKSGPIDVAVSENGTFSAALFDAEYKLVFPSDNVPFITSATKPIVNDTMLVALHGSKTMDIEVIPYYMIRNATFSISKTDSVITGKCKLEQIITGTDSKQVEKVYLYLGRTGYVDDAARVAVTELDGSAITDMNNISMTVKVPTNYNNNAGTQIQQQNYGFVRIGLKVRDKEQLLFSQIERVDF